MIIEGPWTNNFQISEQNLSEEVEEGQGKSVKKR